MFSKELNNVLDSYRATFSGRRKTFGKTNFKIGGRKYYLNFWFNDPSYGRTMTISSIYEEDTHSITRMLEISFRPESTIIKYRNQYYSKDHIPGSTTLLELSSDNHIKEYMSWKSNEYNEFIENLKLFLIEQI